MTKMDRAVCGHAAQHYVCFDLARRGLSTFNNPFEHSPYDIIADHRGRLLRIQVKGTSAPYVAERSRVNSKWTVNAYQFHICEKQLEVCDLIAFVAVDLQTIIYRTPATLENKTGIQFKPDVMQLGCDKDLLTILA